MAPPDPARIARVLERLDAVVAAWPGPERGLAEAALAPARGAAALPGWPPVALPLGLGDAYGLAPDVAEHLAAACVLFFASADVIDDAQDGDLAPAFGDGWSSAVAVGLALMFASQREALAAAPAQGGAIAAAFAEAGLTMSLGQAADVGSKALAVDAIAEGPWLACARGKTGGSIALFATLAPIAAGADAAAVAGLRAWGETAGAALQLASDLADARSPASRDRAAGRMTLPVARAWARLGPGDRPLLEAAWRGEPEAPDLGFLIDRSGAGAYAEARVATLRLEAGEALAAGAVPAPIAAGLEAWLVAMTAPGIRWLADPAAPFGFV